MKNISFPSLLLLGFFIFSSWGSFAQIGSKAENEQQTNRQTGNKLEFSNDTVFVGNRNFSKNPVAIMALDIMVLVNKNLPKNYRNGFYGCDVLHRSKKIISPSFVDFKVKKAKFLDPGILQKLVRQTDSAIQKNIDKPEIEEYLTDFRVQKDKKDSLKLQLNKAISYFEEKPNENKFSSSNPVQYLFNKIESPNTFKLKTGLFVIEDSLVLSKNSTDSLLRTSAVKKSFKKALEKNGFEDEASFNFVVAVGYFDYSIVDVNNFMGKTIYVISFVPKQKPAKFAGKIFVNAKDYAVLKVEYELAEGQHEKKMNLKFPLGIKMEVIEKSGEIIFEKTDEGTYFLNYIKTKTKTYNYLDRNFYLKENVPRGEKPIKLKLGLKVKMTTTKIDKWLFSSIKKSSKKEFQKFLENEGKVWKCIYE